MPCLIDFRRRIRSVKNTQQITKAMKMVSAGQTAPRPGAGDCRAPLCRTHARDPAESRPRATSEDSPWLVRREPKRVDLLFFSSDTGLAGAFNSNLLKAGAALL